MISIIFSSGLVVKVNAVRFENGNLIDASNKNIGVVPNSADCVIIPTNQIIDVVKPGLRVKTAKSKGE